MMESEESLSTRPNLIHAPERSYPAKGVSEAKMINLPFTGSKVYTMF